MTSRWRHLAIPLSAGLLVVLGLCLPWAHLGHRSVSGWHGSANFIGVPCPGYLLALLGGFATRNIVVESNRATKVRSWMPLTVCAYGIFHSAFMAFALYANPSIHAGVGIPVTIGSFAVLSFGVFQQRMT